MERKININEKFFVAGGNGMVGSAIIRKLKKSGYGKKSDHSILQPSKEELDLKDLKETEKWFKKFQPTVVIVAAAKVGGIMANYDNPADFILENLKIQNNLIETSFNFGVKRLLFLGSSCIYPKYSEQPIKEESLLRGELEPTNEYYAIAKISGIKLCESLRKQHSFDAISLMPTNLYGPKDNYHPRNSHVVASLLKKFIEAKKFNISKVKCWGNGTPRREFMHVDDLASAVIFSLERWNPSDLNAPKDENGIPLSYLNVGTGVDITIKKLSEKIAKIVNFKGDIEWDSTKPNGTPRKLLEVSKIKSLGWHAEIDIDKGLQEVFNSLKKDNFFELNFSNH